MGLDYYGILGLKKIADDLEIKSAFRRLILQYNPARQKDESLAELFAMIAEAYEVLSDPLNRAVYDQYGEEGLKNGVPGPEEFIQPFVFHGDPMRTFEEFFGTKNPYADLLDVLANPLPLYSLPEGRGVKRKEPPLIQPLKLTLHEVYHGGVKLIKINRLMLTGDEQVTSIPTEKILRIPFKPGVLPGTELVCGEQGDQGPTIIPADVIFVTEDIPHNRFCRNGVDLLMTCDVTLEEAMVGKTVVVETLDDRILRVPITEIIKPDYTKVIPGEGMPIVGNTTEKGDLIIKFNIIFPDYLPNSSKKLVKKAMYMARIKGDSGQPEQIHTLILADKMRRIQKQDRLPE